MVLTLCSFCSFFLLSSGDGGRAWECLIYQKGKKLLKKVKTFFVLGTRPEVIKLAPVISSLSREKEFEIKIVNTGQHRDMAGYFLQLFGLSPHYDLDVMAAKQSLFILPPGL